MKKTPIYKRSNGLEQSLESYVNCWCICTGGACGCTCSCSNLNVFYNNQSGPFASTRTSNQQSEMRATTATTSVGW